MALRFPTPPGDAMRTKREEQWHIDGMKKRHLSPFQLLVGVALSAQPSDDCGNLAVWPGARASTAGSNPRPLPLRSLRSELASKLAS